jgi:hypothetical protein
VIATYRIAVCNMSFCGGTAAPEVPASERDHKRRSASGKLAVSDSIHTAFLTAYLLTGSCEQSQDSVEEAVRICNTPLDRSELLRNTVRAALRYPPKDANDYPLHPALDRVRMLPNPERRCFILRCLVGMNTGLVARLLLLKASDVSQYTEAGMRLLADVLNA